MLRALNHRNYRLFISGQLVSLVGSGLTRFALGVWVYQRTGSVSQFAMIFLANTLPGIVVEGRDITTVIAPDAESDVDAVPPDVDAVHARA